MVSIDGTDISGVTIDGTPVQEITIDGTVAWTSSLFVDFTTFSPTPPHNYNVYNGTFSVTLETNSHSSNKALYHNQDAAAPDNESKYHYVEQSYDLSNYSTFYFTTKMTTDGPYDALRIDLGSNMIFNHDSAQGSHDWTQRTHDVSGINGTVSLKIGHHISQNRTREPKSWVVDAYFE